MRYIDVEVYKINWLLKYYKAKNNNTKWKFKKFIIKFLKKAKNKCFIKF